MKTDQPDPIRRSMFAVGCAGMAASLGGFVAATLRYLVPNVLYEPSRRFDIGPPTAFPVGSATFLPDRRLYVFNEPDGLYAISAICTHLGCTVRRGGAGFECPCHGSRFDANGAVIHGPAPNSLEWYALSLSPRSRLVVDLDMQVGPEFRLRA
jgi:menaquinol-cytochrome c reductase iron-sulfur subunit